MDQVGQRREGLLDRRDVAGHVQLVEVDVVGLQPPQAAPRPPADVAPRRPGAVVGADPPAPAELGRDHELVALALERVAQHRLRAPNVAPYASAVSSNVTPVSRAAARMSATPSSSTRREGVAADADGAHHQAGVAQRAVRHLAHDLRRRRCAVGQVGRGADPLHPVLGGLWTRGQLRGGLPAPAARPRGVAGVHRPLLQPHRVRRVARARCSPPTTCAR